MKRRNEMRKKVVATLLVALVVLTGCSNAQASKTNTAKDNLIGKWAETVAQKEGLSQQLNDFRQNKNLESVTYYKDLLREAGQKFLNQRQTYSKESVRTQLLSHIDKLSLDNTKLKEWVSVNNLQKLEDLTKEKTEIKFQLNDKINLKINDKYKPYLKNIDRLIKEYEQLVD